ncbi:MAG TPA: membrane protein insertase YidC [Chitinophagaceae bacterium]|nr:membrane protein insertase YidC [Chitinophagaceae bacterium]
MNFDRNTVIGFVVLALLFFGYFYFINKEQSANRQKKIIEDSIANSQSPQPVSDTIAEKKLAITNDSIAKLTSAGQYQKAISGTEQIVYAENDVFRIAFTNKGGQPQWVELKKFRDQDSSLVRLSASEFDKINYPINTASNQSANITDMFFMVGGVTGNADMQTVSFTLAADSAGPSIIHQFVIRKNDYMIDFNVKMQGADQLLSQQALNITWKSKAVQLERDLNYEKQQTQIGYSLGGDYDYHTVGMKSNKEFTDPLHWVAVKQQFFNRSFIAKNNFKSGRIDWIVPDEKEKIVVQATAVLRMEVPGSSAEIPFALYYGPNDYKILKSYNIEMENLVNLGQGVFSFVKWINRWLVLPVFDFFKSFIGSYGIVILLLTFFLRLIISPLTYSSYLSGAKMKALRPEIEKLKAKFGKDQQQMSMEQMKLFREAGVNPLGGCIPALLQIPIFFALYSFFNANVALRGENFLWANDLSSYDSILNLGFTIPLYGDHISLFTITACITSFIISIYSMSMTPDQNNPVLKYMPYIFPFFLLFIFNRLPSALTWYYTVSNLVTLALQFAIQTYIIDHDKILSKIEENRKKPKPKSKWQEKFDNMQEQQKKMKETQAKNKR